MLKIQIKNISFYYEIKKVNQDIVEIQPNQKELNIFENIIKNFEEKIDELN